MLKLVVNNTKINKPSTNQITCRNSCELYDFMTENCSIKKNINVDSLIEVRRCGHFLPKSSNNISKAPMKSMVRFTLLEGAEEYSFEDEDIFQGLVGENFNTEKSTYPLKPDFPSSRDDALWYVSPDESYGCWIINKSQHRLLSVPSADNVEVGWSQKVYKSPVPLHDHKSSLSLASKMAWVVDEDGFGQYVLLVNGKISTLTSPRPANWYKKH